MVGGYTSYILHQFHEPHVRCKPRFGSSCAGPGTSSAFRGRQKQTYSLRSMPHLGAWLSGLGKSVMETKRMRRSHRWTCPETTSSCQEGGATASSTWMACFGGVQTCRVSWYPKRSNGPYPLGPSSSCLRSASATIPRFRSVLGIARGVFPHGSLA